MDQPLRAAVESAPAGLIMTDAAGRMVLVNRETERLFGYPREELLGQSIEILVPERFRGQFPGFRAEFLSDPKVRTMGAGRELFARRKDGTEVPVDVGLTPVATAEGMFVLGTVVDQSARKRAEDRFRAAVESSPNGMVMVDGTGRILLVNREVERLFGYSRDELIGRSIEALVPERFRGRHPGFRAAFFSTPQARSMGAGRELFGLRKDGVEVPVEIGLNPIETEEGLFVLSSIVDISARKWAEEERQRLEEQLRQAHKMEAIGTLAGGIAHDFNNLLGAIVGYAELLRPQLRHQSGALADLEEILKAAQRGRELIERILAFSRRQSPNRMPLDLRHTVHEVQQLLRATIPTTVELRLNLPPTPQQVSADETSIHQVVMNLANNAVQAMPEGGVLDIGLEGIYVRDSVARANPDLHEGLYALLTIRDSGGGIPPAVRDRVFEPFFTTKGPGSGSGLGLAVVHAIMHDLQGTVALESEVGRGTAVRCFFPALETEQLSALVEETAVPPGSGERVLFLDDEPALAQVGSRRLGSLHYQVTEETDPLAALERFRSDPAGFDLIITDFTMPRMTGLDFAEAAVRIRADIPILMATGFVEEIPESRLIAAGVRSVLRKPLTMEQLSRAVREALDG
ncbi:MAG TPA: PAS domain S-box protein [Gemmatimonadales bacterium]|jgi:hypothetical protein|nr:PAS domain S-box protein [Gemmatimonadales bacterium]